MKRILLILFTLTSLFSLNSSLTCNAQTSAVQKVGKSVFTLTTYKADGTILATTHGVYTGNEHEGISAFTPFVGAASAVVIDGAGKKYDVETICGANDMYDICRFKLSGGGNPIMTTSTPASAGAWVVGYSTKKPTITKVTVKSTEKFLDKYTYYVFNEEVNEDILGCPIVNDNGEVVGLVQQSSSNYDIHSTDAQYYLAQTTTGLSLQDAALRKTSIRAALPDDHEQARLMMLMVEDIPDSVNTVKTINDYINAYPTDVDGYLALAKMNINHNNLKLADDAMEAAVKKVANKDEAYSEYAKLIYNAIIYLPDSVECEWNMEKAEKCIDEAIAINPLSVYKHQKAQILFAKGDYNAASALFEEISNADLKSSEVFYELAQCKAHTEGTKEEIIDYLNKSVEAAPQPLSQVSAPYILARGKYIDGLGEYRKALQDYNVYDSLMNYNASHDFYYIRFRCEVNARQYQQALNDIAHAAILNPMEVTYLAEMASLQLRLGKYEEALRTCELSMRVTDQYADIYIVEGVAYAKLDRMDEAKAAFDKATELGDERGAAYKEKYCK